MIKIKIITNFINNIINNNFFLYKRVLEKKIINIQQFLLSDIDKNVDDKIYGNEFGMLYKFIPINNLLKKMSYDPAKQILIYPHPSGALLNNSIIKYLINSKKDLIFICDRYEGIDSRIIKKFNPLMISLGNFIISNGELATNVIIDSIVRHLLLSKQVLDNESFEPNNNFLLDNFYFTKPRKINNMKVPKILLSGHHKNIKDYQWERRLLNTLLFKKKFFINNFIIKKLNIHRKKIIIKHIIKLLKIFLKIIDEK